MIRKYNLLLKVLKKLDEHNLLDHLVLIGSWCLPFYSNYYEGIEISSTLRTRGVDFVFPLPSKIKEKLDVPKMMEEIGFIVDFSNSGIIRLMHPELFIDFIVPDRGKDLPSPYKMPNLSLNSPAIKASRYPCKQYNRN